MDISDIRGYLTPALGIALFVWIATWAYGRKSRQVYDEAANLPFADDDDDSASVQAVVADQRKKT
ncbi:MAG: CcoQ/FixQ family Cbb3-type cytochrome c oxidase assembly chaperone [Zoogloeaceae bacterium]|jgi:cytochrome c oxidase cbb3-type subunit 4|nr:CcoQ/FixQ family Cbb3-type cytochrome c oxidase assembly chaperone [Zoogloeaceae bacterium]